jgi:hypothetical protein
MTKVAAIHAPKQKMRSLRRAAILGANALFAAAHAQPQPSTADIDLELLRTLAPEIPDATLLTMQDLTAEQARKVSTTPGIGRRFEGDFNLDGQRDLALFGQYADGDSVGTLLLIASRQAERWRREALLRFPQPFIIGLQHEHELSVAFCTGCDFGGRVSWSGSRYEFVPSQSAGVEP